MDISDVIDTNIGKHVVEKAASNQELFDVLSAIIVAKEHRPDDVFLYADNLSAMTTWAFTPQGTDFWNELYERFSAGDDDDWDEDDD